MLIVSVVVDIAVKVEESSEEEAINAGGEGSLQKAQLHHGS